MSEEMLSRLNDVVLYEIGYDSQYCIDDCCSVIDYFKRKAISIQHLRVIPHKPENRTPLVDLCLNSDREIRSAISYVLDNELSLEIKFELPSMRCIPYLYGNHWYVTINGAQSMNAMSMVHGFISIQAGRYVDQFDDNVIKNIFDHEYPLICYRNVSKYVSKHFESIFLDLCAIRDGGIPYAFMRMDIYSLSPFASSMVYYKDIHDFAHDYIRFYEQYHKGLLMAEMLRGYNYDMLAETLAIEVDGKERLQKRRIDYITNIYRSLSNASDKPMLVYINNLDENTALRYAGMPEEHIRGCLLNLPLTLNINAYINDRGGIALTTDPLTSVWRAYQYIADCYELQ